MVSAKVAGTKPWVFVSAILLSALTFAVALAWNDLVRAALKETINTDNDLIGVVIYASVVTSILIIASYFLAKIWPDVLKNI